MPVIGQKRGHAGASSVGNVVVEVPAESSGMGDLETGPSGGEHMREERCDDVWDRLVQQSYRRHAKDPELEGDEHDVLTLGVIQAARSE